MRLIKQSFLYFKEGNSDKVYVIDLCELGNVKYLVNFHYGRKDTPLKDGSKTPLPVNREEAERIYDAVEGEKLRKGYRTSVSGEPVMPAETKFTIDSSKIRINNNWPTLLSGRNKAIIQRLHDTVNGVNAHAAHPWNLSRIIWKAGEYRIGEAAYFIIKLFNNGNRFHEYSCTWALSRCAAGDPDVLTVLQTIYRSHPDASISKIAGIGLTTTLAGPEKAVHLTHYLNRLPEEFKKIISTADAPYLDKLFSERIAQEQPDYKWLEDTYILSIGQQWMRRSVHKILTRAPLRPRYFKHVRAVFKAAELLDDFETTALLAWRFERETEMFSHHYAKKEAGRKEIFIEEIDEQVNLLKELKKPDSRLAYSQKTRWYLHNRVLRQLQMLGKNDDESYVKLATALLIAYKAEDFKNSYSTFEYIWKAGSYERVETRFLQNAHAIFLNQIISGDNPQITLQSNHLWREADNNLISPSSQQEETKSSNSLGNFIKKITGFFANTKTTGSTGTEKAVPIASQQPLNANGTPFLHLWNKMPQAYIQLLMDSALEKIHRFAETNLLLHPDFNTIKNKLDEQACRQLLLSPYQIPAQFGYRLAAEKYSGTMPGTGLVEAMLNSTSEEAVITGKQWVETYQSVFFLQSGFITQLIFAKHASVRNWIKPLLQNAGLSPEIKNAIVVRSIAAFMNCREQTTENELLANDAGDTLLELLENELKQISTGVIADLLQHQNAAVLLFGLKLLHVQKHQLSLHTVPKKFLFDLLHHAYAPVREEGIALLAGIDVDSLLLYQHEIINACLSMYENVRQGLSPVIQRMAQEDISFGLSAVEALLPVLLRKETSIGLHRDISKMLCNELSSYLHDADHNTAFNLLYSNYSAAQNVGVVMLEKYADPSRVTILQVIALGNHENLHVREWCWKFYREQPARIRYEKEISIKLLDSKWQDTLQFAMQYFREQFTETDWSPEILITLADSVKPAVEAFGREMITRFFTTENGATYLLKLSQHPSAAMQLFATGYLERFAADDAAKIRSLDYYFRAVLTRVNKGRIAKDRIYAFLLQEGRKSEAAAKTVCALLSDLSASAAVGDKAICIDILLQLNALYDVDIPIKLKEPELRHYK